MKNYIILTAKNAEYANTQFMTHMIKACKNENIECCVSRAMASNNTSSCVIGYPEIQETHRFIFLGGQNLRFTHHEFENSTYHVTLEEELYLNYMLLDVVMPHMVVRNVND